MPLLIISSDNADTSALPYHVPEVHRPNESVELAAAMDDSGLGQKPMASATAKLLRGVRDSAEAFVPLKSIAGHLHSVLGNCQVWLPPMHLAHGAYSHSSKQMWMYRP